MRSTLPTLITLLLLFPSLSSSLFCAVNSSFLPSGEGSFFNASLWSCGRVPIVGDDVLVDIGQFSCADDPPFLVIDRPTPALNSFLVLASDLTSLKTGSCPSSVIVTAQLTAATVTFQLYSTLGLVGGATVRATTSLQMDGGNIGGTYLMGVGTIDTPLAIMGGLISPAVDGAVQEQCRFSFPGAAKYFPGAWQYNLADSVLPALGDITFTGAFTSPKTTPTLFMYYNTSDQWTELPGRSALDAGSYLPHIHVLGALTMNLTYMTYPNSGPALSSYPPALTYDGQLLTYVSLGVQANPICKFSAKCLWGCGFCKRCLFTQGNPPGPCATRPQTSSTLGLLLAPPPPGALPNLGNCPSAPTACSPGCVNGQCVVALGFCQCNAGWSGALCDMATSCAGGCGPTGTCDLLSGAPVCNCVGSAYGPTCGVNSFSVSGCPPCVNGGACVNGACSCTPAWRGNQCHIPVCPGYNAATNTSNCNGQGQCGNGLCSCSSGWSGADCSVRSAPASQANLGLILGVLFGALGAIALGAILVFVLVYFSKRERARVVAAAHKSLQLRMAEL